MKFDGEYYRALIGTTLMMISIALGSFLVGYPENFSFMWFVGAINITGCFALMLYINYKFIVYNKGD